MLDDPLVVTMRNLVRKHHLCIRCTVLCFCRGGCRSLSGTSVASPVVAGAVTLLYR